MEQIHFVSIAWKIRTRGTFIHLKYKIQGAIKVDAAWIYD